MTEEYSDMLYEAKKLVKKIRRLERRLNGGEFNTKSVEEHVLVCKQLSAMDAYLAALNGRINLENKLGT